MGWKGACIRAVAGWLVYVALTSLLGCTAVAQNLQGESFETELAEERKLTSISDFADELQKADFIILGERHDNPEHHRLQLAILQELYSRGWLKQLSLEMLKPSQQEAIDLALQKKITDKDVLQKILAWEHGWDWELYGPILSWAIALEVPVKSANLDDDELGLIRKQPIPSKRRVLGEEELNIHRLQFRVAHCGYVNEGLEESMLRVQLARDARMAASLLSVSSGAALLAGNWHARKDIGVPQYVLNQKPEARILAMGFVEETPVGDESLEAYYDVTLKTGPVIRQDFCDLIKQKLSKKP